MDDGSLAFIGAYERDNFGDLLFPWVTAQVLNRVDVEYLAAFDGTVDHLVGRRVRSWVDVLPHVSFEGIWCVGGEVASATGETALRYHTHTPNRNDRRQAEGEEFAYIPRPSQHYRTLATPLILNSVGLASVGPLRPEEEIGLQYTLREADFISVRDQASADYLKALGIDCMLSPDVVSIIRDLHAPASRSGQIAVQVSDATVAQFGLTEIADGISRSIGSNDELVLFAAGLAPNHDSFAKLGGLRDLLSSRGHPATLVECREPLAIVDVIASARLVIATSLHCRIVAAAYDVPRISLQNSKVAQYAETWDSGWPYGVAPRDLCRFADVRASNERLSVGKGLAGAARKSVSAGVEHLKGENAASRASGRLAVRTEHIAELGRLVGGARQNVEDLRERVFHAERGVLPLAVLAKGFVRRTLKRSNPAERFGEPLA